jgi:hypothetical protein
LRVRRALYIVPGSLMLLMMVVEVTWRINVIRLMISMKIMHD